MKLYRDGQGNHHIINSDGAWLTIEDGVWSYGWITYKTDVLLYEDERDVYKRERQ